MQRENAFGRYPDEPSPYPDARPSRDGAALHGGSGIQHGRVGARRFRGPRWFRRPWRFRRIPRWRLSWRRIWPWPRSRLLTLWLLRWILSVLRRILPLRGRRGRLLRGPAARGAALRLADTPRQRLRVMATPPGLGVAR